MTGHAGRSSKKLRARITEIIALTDRFCQGRLDDEYRRLCRELAAEVCRAGCPVTSGKAAGWAAGVAYSIAWVNFLGDPSQPHHMTAEDSTHALGVSEATLMSRSRIIRNALDLERMDPRWSTRSITEQNPLAWLVEVNGMPFDIRNAPRRVQEDAFRRGLIPWVPDESASATGEGAAEKAE